MSKIVQVGDRHLIFAVAFFQTSGVMMFMPAALAAAAGPDAWMVPPISFLLGSVPIAFLLHQLAKYHPRRTLSEIALATLGPVLGRLVLLPFLALGILLCSLVIRDIVDFSAVTILPRTPMLMVGTLFALALGYAVYCGIEVVVRFAVLVVLLTAIPLIIIPMGLVPMMDLLRIRPFLGEGLIPLLQGAWSTLGWYGEIVLFGELLGRLDQPRRTFSSLAWGSFIGLILLEVLVINTLLVLGPNLTARLVFPTLSLVQQVTLGDFLERMEILLITVWLFQMVIKGAIALWASVSCGQWLLGLKNDRVLIPPFLIAALSLTLIWPSVMALIDFSAKYWTPLAYPVEVGLPLLLLVVSWWQSKRRRSQASC